MEDKLAEFVRRLKQALGDDLKAVILYGSALTSEFQSKHSDVNTLCIVEHSGYAQLDSLHEAVRWWTRQGHGHPVPLVFTFDELRRSADVFAIELVDIKLHHRMLFGTDFFDQFEVPLRLHTLQLEREFRVNWIRMREAVLSVPPRRTPRLGIMLSSVSSFCTLFRHALWALTGQMPSQKREAVDGIAALTGGNPTGFRIILDLREGKIKPRKIDIEDTLRAYLELVEIATNEIDRRLEAQ